MAFCAYRRDRIACWMRRHSPRGERASIARSPAGNGQLFTGYQPQQFAGAASSDVLRFDRCLCVFTWTDDLHRLWPWLRNPDHLRLEPSRCQSRVSGMVGQQAWNRLPLGIRSGCDTTRDAALHSDQRRTKRTRNGDRGNRGASTFTSRAGKGHSGLRDHSRFGLERAAHRTHPLGNKMTRRPRTAAHRVRATKPA